MSHPDLLEIVLDSWDRNNTILVNLLHLIPEDAFALSAIAGSPTITKLFTHMHYVRLVFVAEDAPEHARPMPDEEWQAEYNRERIAQQLHESALAVRNAVQGRIQSGRPMDLHYDHPILMLQHLIWHEGYHQGQIKLTLKAAGHPIDDEKAGPLTWDIWMDKS